jgi:hypothetical protein
MEPEVSLPRWRGHATDPCPDPYESNPHPPTQFPQYPL